MVNGSVDRRKEEVGCWRGCSWISCNPVGGTLCDAGFMRTKRAKQEDRRKERRMAVFLLSNTTDHVSKYYRLPRISRGKHKPSARLLPLSTSVFLVLHMLFFFPPFIPTWLQVLHWTISKLRARMITTPASLSTNFSIVSRR